MLRALGEDVVPLREEYPADTPDAAFLAAFKGRDIVLVSANTSQRTDAIEGRLLKESGVTSLYLGPFWGMMTFWEQARWLVRHWTVIDGFVKGVERGACAELKQNGRAKLFRL